MSKKFEIHIETKNIISNKNLVDLINELEVDLDFLHIIDTWDYDNELILDLDQIDSINSLIEFNKIVILEGYSGPIKCGAFISKNDCLNYEYALWFSTDFFEGLGNNQITENNKNIYNRIFQLLEKYCGKQNIIFCAMGLEMYITDTSDLNEKADKSVGVIRWIVQEENKLNLTYYIEEIKDGLRLYSIY